MLRNRLDATAAVPLSMAHDFEGERCDRLVASVLAALQAMGVVRTGP